MSGIPGKDRPKNGLFGLIHIIPLLLIFFLVAGSLVVLNTNAGSRFSRNSSGMVLSKSGEENMGGKDEGKNDDNEEDVDSDDGADTESENETELESEIEELEFEESNITESRVGDENEVDGEENDGGVNEDSLITEDVEQSVEIITEGGKFKLKIKTRTQDGEEVENELETSGLEDIANIRVKTVNGETRLRVRTQDGRVIITENLGEAESSVITELPLDIDSAKNRIRVKTESGYIALSEFPAGVVKNLLSSQNLEAVNSLELKLKSGEPSEAVYYVLGDNDVKLFGLFKVTAKVESEVNARTGEQSIVSQPWYLKYLGFLFSS